MIRLREMTRNTLDDLARVDLLMSKMLQGMMELATHLHQHPSGQSKGLRRLIEDLLHASRECVRLPNPPTMSSVLGRG